MNSQIGKCSLLQLNFLLKLIKSSDHIDFAESSVQAGAILALYKKGWIRPFGTINKKQRWQLVQSFSKEEVDYMRQITQNF